MAVYLKESGDKYIWLGGFETKDIPKRAGFKWSPDARQWWTSFRDNAVKLSKYASPELRAELEGYTEKKEESLAMSRAASADIDLPRPEGLDYLPFQRAGIQYALQRDNVLLGDEMGLGKTIQAIGVINAKPEIERVLVVAPASLKLNWKRELEKWLTRPMSVGVANGGLPDTDVVIVNYDVLKKFKNELQRDWDMLIADEAHYIKNPDAQRTQLLVGGDKKKEGKYVHIPGIADSAKRKMFITGTPILNRPIELWPIVSSLAPATFPSFMSFAKRYADAKQGRYGWDFSGASNLDELQDKLRSTVMVRRLKKDVLAELPPKRRQVVELEPDGEARKAVTREQEVSRKHETELQRLRADVELAKASDDGKTYEEAVAKLKSASQVAFEDISKERHEVALAKVPQVIEHLRDVLEQQDKVVVFAHHRDVIDAIISAFPDQAVKLTGEDSVEERQRSVDDFQSKKDVKLFVGSIHAAGVGITLTAASHVIFAELDWVPANITQAEDRLHRIGQTGSVLVQHLVFDGSLDSKMAKTLVDKQAVIDSALDIEPPPTAPIDEPETMKVSRKTLSEYEDLSDGEVATVMSALKFLAGVDDGAQARDSAGFNKVDTMIGQRLAMQPNLTQKQARLGAVLVQKYRKQIELAGLAVPELPTRKRDTGTSAVAKAEEAKAEAGQPATVAGKPAPEPIEVEEPKEPVFELVLEGFDEGWKSKPRHIAYNKSKDKFPIVFPYDATLVSVVKSIPGVRFNRDTKNWDLSDLVADVDAIKKMVKFAEEYGFVFSAGARDKIKEIVEQAGGKLVVSGSASELELAEAGPGASEAKPEQSGTRQFAGNETEYFERAGKGGVQVGEIVMSSGKPYMVTGVDKPVHLSQDWLDDMDEFEKRPGWYTSYQAREVAPTEEELGEQKQEEQAKENARKLQVQLYYLKGMIQKHGERPEGDNSPDGERLFDTQTIYGGGDWFVLGDKEIWYVRNNGADGDDWSANNVRTGGAGAIGWRIPYLRSVADKLKSLTQVQQVIKDKGELPDDIAKTAFEDVPESVFDTSKTPTRVELESIESQRPTASRMQDEMLSHHETVSLDAAGEIRGWLKDPGSVDIQGIDSPGEQRFVRRRKKRLSGRRGTPSMSLRRVKL